jgi:urease accessory protein
MALSPASPTRYGFGAIGKAGPDETKSDKQQEMPMLRAVSHLHAGEDRASPFDVIVLDHARRHLRRKRLILQHGDPLLVDLPDPVTLAHGDALVLEDGRVVEIIAADEELYAVAGRDPAHLSALAWHLGNRHLPAQIEADRILIARDHVIRKMLEGLGAAVTETVEPFEPARGAYHAHGEALHPLHFHP